MANIYIVEDELPIAASIAEYLQTWQMNTTIAKDFQNITDEVRECRPDLILMDIKLPFYNGFYWCGEIRKFSQVPIVFLSSADDNMNIVMAMNMGADDFISKPFDLMVLSAKIQAILRRVGGTPSSSRILSHLDLNLNLDNTTANYKGTPIELTKNEFIILGTLLHKAGKVVSREELMEKLWGNDEFVDDNTLTVNITRIRKKLDAVGCENYIETKRGLGYIVKESESI